MEGASLSSLEAHVLRDGHTDTLLWEARGVSWRRVGKSGHAVAPGCDVPCHLSQRLWWVPQSVHEAHLTDLLFTFCGV